MSRKTEQERMTEALLSELPQSLQSLGELAPSHSQLRLLVALGDAGLGQKVINLQTVSTQNLHPALCTPATIDAQMAMQRWGRGVPQQDVERFGAFSRGLQKVLNNEKVRQTHVVLPAAIKKLPLEIRAEQLWRLATINQGDSTEDAFLGGVYNVLEHPVGCYAGDITVVRRLDEHVPVVGALTRLEDTKGITEEFHFDDAGTWAARYEVIASHAQDREHSTAFFADQATNPLINPQ